MQTLEIKSTWICWMSNQSPADRDRTMAWKDCSLKDAVCDELAVQGQNFRTGDVKTVRALDLGTGSLWTVSVTCCEENEYDFAVFSYRPQKKTVPLIQNLIGIH